MNKKIIVGIVVVALAIVVVKFLTDTPTQTATTVYSDGSETVEASFDNDNETVTFTQSAVGTVTLPRAISASGARFANEAESIVFWEHQQEVTITRDGEEIFRGRVVDPGG